MIDIILRGCRLTYYRHHCTSISISILFIPIRSKLTKWVTNQNQCYFNSLNIADNLLLLTLVCAYDHFIKISIVLISPYNLGYHLLSDWELEQISMPLLKIEENIFYSSSLFWPPNIPQGSCSSAMECTRKYFILHQVRTLIWGCRDNSQV